MKGLLLVNGYLNSEKFNNFYSFIMDSFLKEGIELVIKTNIELTRIINEKIKLDEKPDFILFFDKDVTLARRLELEGYKVFNSSSAIEICDDKALTHLELINNPKIKMPKTLILPFSYKKELINVNFVLNNGFSYPFIVKERKGSFGEQVYLVYSEDDWNKIITETSSSLLVQEYISYRYHEDVRIHVVNNEVVSFVKRIGKDNDFRANVTNGGHMEVYDLPSSFIEMAIEVSKTLKLDFAGLDFLFDEFDNPIFLEANSNAHFVNIYKTNGVNVATYMAKYIKNTLKK